LDDNTKILANEGQFKPIKTLIVYRKMSESDPYYEKASSPKCYVSLHNIRDGVVCEGHPVSKKDVYELCKLAMPGSTPLSVTFLKTSSPMRRLVNTAQCMVDSCRQKKYVL